MKEVLRSQQECLKEWDCAGDAEFDGLAVRWGHCYLAGRLRDGDGTDEHQHAGVRAVG